MVYELPEKSESILNYFCQCVSPSYEEISANAIALTLSKATQRFQNSRSSVAVCAGWWCDEGGEAFLGYGASGGVPVKGFLFACVNKCGHVQSSMNKPATCPKSRLFRVNRTA